MITYSYDENGNVLQKVDGRGTVTYTYDLFNRIKTKTYSLANTPAVTYCYDGDTSGGCAGAPTGANLKGRLPRGGVAIR